MYPNVRLFNLEIHTFNICIILAMIVAILVFVHQTKGAFEPTVQDTLIAIFGADVPFIIGGAILHNKIVYAKSFTDFIHLIHRNTGIAFFGGFIGGFIGFVILFKLMIGKKVSMKYTMDQIAPAIMIGHAIGRIGCLLGGCCFGKPCRIGLSFALGTPAYNMYGAKKLFPTQLLESILLIGMFVIACKIKKNRTEFYLISYSVIRFFLEFIRGDDRGNVWLFFSPAQVISIVIFGITVIVLCMKKKNI